MKKLTYIKTIGELKQNIGQVLHFSYINEYGKEVAYMKKITKISDKTFNGKKITDTDQIPKGFIMYGINLVIIKSNITKINKPYVRHLNNEKMSNAFDNIRIPTKEEMNFYKNILRHARIFGLEKS